MQREIILQELILYLVQSLSQFVVSLSIFPVPSQVIGCLPFPQELQCEGITWTHTNNIQGVQTQLFTEVNCITCVTVDRTAGKTTQFGVFGPLYNPQVIRTTDRGMNLLVFLHENAFTDRGWAK